MSQDDRLKRRTEAAAEFDRHEERNDGLRVANSLGDGLALLRETLYSRVHTDVKHEFGTDSMLAPFAAGKTEAKAKLEIDLYQIAESAAIARQASAVSTQDEWCIGWLGRLKLGEQIDLPEIAQRLAGYAAKTSDERRRAFAVALERIVPDARRAPLIVYRLFPLAVAVATGLALNSRPLAAEARKRQLAVLPGIGDCHDCKGALLENGEKCQQCGNPFWKNDWLTSD